MAGNGSEETGLSSKRTVTGEEPEGLDDFALAAIILASVLVVVLVVLVICSRCRRCSKLCPCSKASRGIGEDFAAGPGYFPANIAVNSAALEQGIPDIFMRANSQGGDGRISLEPYSLENSSSRVLDSPTEETSGAWTEFLRRVTLVRRGGGGGEGAAGSHEEDGATRVSSAMSQERVDSQGAGEKDGPDPHGITNPVTDSAVRDNVDP